MRLPALIITPIALALSLLAAGCAPSQPHYLRQTDDLSYYIDKATEVSYPDVETAALEEAHQTQSPITVLSPDNISFEDLTLEDIVSIALQNSKMIRGYGAPGLQGNVIAPGVDSLAINPQGAGSMYNVAINESEPGFLPTLGSPGPPGVISSNTALETQQGVEAALSEFDAHYSGVVSYDKTDRPRNTIPSRGGILFDSQRFRQDAMTISNQISKKSATGTQLFFRSNTDYLRNNIPSDVQPLRSVWTQAFEAEVRQPLLRGRGALVNRMPVIVARIQSDQELALLESQLQNMICNLEIRYWNLHCSYRIFETAQTSLNMANYFRRMVQERSDEGTASQADVSQAIEQYHFFRTAMEQSFADLVDAENDLRWLMGWAPTDGRLIRPADDPLTGYVDFDWQMSLTEALVRRPEIRLERWEIKKREMLLAYARNSLLPSVNATGLYRWVGLGDDLWGTQRNGVEFPNVGSRAIEELTGGNYQEVSLGLEFNSTIGFRREHANVRNAQLKLAREVARLEDIELDTARELTMVVRAIDTNFSLAEANLARFAAAYDEFNSHKDYIEGGGADGPRRFDRLLDSQRRQADAQSSYYRSICEYNKALALLHRRKGTIMEYSGVHFAEGPWPDKAYVDASEHARRRSASREIDYGWTRPGVISRGTLPSTGGEVILEGGEMYGGETYDEIIPSEMAPTPATPSEDFGDGLPPAPPELPEDLQFNDAQAIRSSETSQASTIPTTVEATPAATRSISTPVEQVRLVSSEVEVESSRPLSPATTATQPLRTRQAQSPASTVRSGGQSSVSEMWKQMGLGDPNDQTDRSEAVIRPTGRQTQR